MAYPKPTSLFRSTLSFTMFKPLQILLKRWHPVFIESDLEEVSAMQDKSSLRLSHLLSKPAQFIAFYASTPILGSIAMEHTIKHSNATTSCFR